MNRITKHQFHAMLLIPDAFLLLCIQGSLSLMTVIGIAAGAVVQAAVVIPFVLMFRDREELPKWAMSVVGAYVIFCGGLLMNRLRISLQALYIPYETGGEISGGVVTWLILGLVALVCIYMSSAGIKALSRASVIAIAVGALYLVILAVSAAAKSDLTNIARTWETDGFRGAFADSFLLTGGLGGAMALIGITKGEPIRDLSEYLLIRVIMSTVVITAAILVEGGISAITDFPVITAAQLSQPFQSQRIDSLLLMIFAVFAVFSIAVQSAAAAYLIRKIVPEFKKYRSIAAIALISAVSLII